MRTYRLVVFLLIILTSFKIISSVQVSRALFTDSIQVASNNISTGSWPSPTPTSVPIPTPTPTSIPTPTPDPSAANTRVDPASTTVAVGQNFTVNLVVDNAINLAGFQAKVSFNPNTLSFVSATLGSFLSTTGRSVSPLGPMINNTTGTVTYGSYSFGLDPLGPNGNGTVAIFTFRAKAVGQSNLDLSNIQMNDPYGTSQINGQITGGTVVVQ